MCQLNFYWIWRDKGLYHYDHDFFHNFLNVWSIIITKPNSCLNSVILIRWWHGFLHIAKIYIDFWMISVLNSPWAVILRILWHLKQICANKYRILAFFSVLRCIYVNVYQIFLWSLTLLLEINYRPHNTPIFFFIQNFFLF